MSDLMVIITTINILARIIAISLLSFYVLPVQIREARINDEIGRTRKALLGVGIGIILSTAVVTLIQICRFEAECRASLIIDYLSLSNSVGIILTAIGFMLMYRYKKAVDKQQHKRS